MSEEVQAGSLWVMDSDKDNSNPFKIMTIVDNYVMLRRKGCVPTIQHVKKFGDNKQFRRLN